jgi:hypothetical protein
MAALNVEAHRAFADLVKPTSDPNASPNCSTEKSFIDYLQFAALFCKDYSSNPANYINFMEYVPMLWLWVVLACYERVTYSPRLQSNSCNASFTFLSGDYRNHEERLIIKLQMSPNADNIVIDNINGHVINAVVPPSIQKHYMEFIDSCLTYVDAAHDSFDLGSVLMASKSLVDNMTLFQRLDEMGKSHKLVKVSLNRAVAKPVSLSDYLLDGTVDMRSLLTNMLSLFDAMRIMGETYGLTHNDAHLGNILHDGVEDCFVLIDYGRMLFCPQFMDSNIMTDIRTRLTFERIKAGELNMEASRICGNQAYDLMVGISDRLNDYSEFMDDQMKWSASRMIDLISAGSRQNNVFALRHLFMFDIMAISINTLAHIHFRRLPAFFKELQDFFRAESVTWKRRSYLSYQIPTVPVVMRMIHKTKNNVFLAGVFWFAFLMQYLMQNDSDSLLYVQEERDDLTGDLWYVVNLTNLSDMGIIFRSMVLLELPDPDQFMSYVEAHQHDIETVCSMLLTKGLRNSKGGSKGKNKKLKSNLNENSKTLKTSVKKATTKMFEAEFHAYTGGKIASKLKQASKKGGGSNAVGSPQDQQQITDNLIFDASIGGTNQCPRQIQRRQHRSTIDTSTLEVVDIPLAKTR